MVYCDQNISLNISLLNTGKKNQIYHGRYAYLEKSKDKWVKACVKNQEAFLLPQDRCSQARINLKEFESIILN